MSEHTSSSEATGSDAPIVGRLTTPTVIAVQLGGLVTALLWAFYGWAFGAPALAVSIAALWRAWQTGFVLDASGLQMRAFLPGGSRTFSWPQLVSVDVDEVVVGTETRSRRPRVRFFVDGERPQQVIGCKTQTIDDVIGRFRSRGLEAHDRRALADR